MIETRGFTGKLNTDDNDYRIPNGDYVAALNITRDAQGHGQDEVVSNIPGNQSIPSLFGNAGSDVIGSIVTTQITFEGSALPLLTILVRIYNGSTYTTLSTYTTSGHSSIAQITAGLLANAATISGISYSASPSSFSVTFNNTVYQSVSFSITNTMTGTNKVIGNYADRVRNRQYYFTWNSDGYNTINYYDANNNVVVNLMTDKTDTGGTGVLNFDPSYRINHIDIIYRDEGDLLFWTDGLNPPRKLNVDTILEGGYGTILSSYLDVAKEPPSAPPYCVYEDDATVTVNNLQNKQFKFKTRFVFDDNEKSVTSAQSAIAIPYNYTNQTVLSDPTKNADIFIAYQTGAKNVTRIEILGSESIGETWSDFFLVQVINKSISGLSDNDVAYFRFYNNEAYNTIPLNESIQPFDNVPQKAYTQSLPNGNVLDYGAITENYDLFTPTYSATASTRNQYQYANATLFLAYQSAQPAFGAGNIKIIVAGQPLLYGPAGTTLQLNILVGATPVSLTVNASTVINKSIAIVISELTTQATSNGFTIVSSSANTLVINKANAVLQTVINTSNSQQVLNLVSETLLNSNSQLSHDWSSKYSYGVVYFDEKGRTNGVITNISSSFQTQSYSENVLTALGHNFLISCNVPSMTFQINSRPPLWASYFEIVRTKNLTKSSLLYWASLLTYKDTSPGTDGYTYAYININNLTQYLAANPNIKTLGYEFTPGDRIRFVKLYEKVAIATTNPATKYVYSDKDYEIIDSLINPTINGSPVIGQVLKIYLPTTSATFDFGIGFDNYLIELYTPAPNFSNQTNLYYEFGERYIVGNPGTDNAYHQGMTQNQSSDLSTPALYTFYKGDVYYRLRKIYIDSTYSIGQGIMDFNFSDNYDSASAPVGRAWIFDPNAQQSFNPTLIRFGGEYQPGTTVNDINRFYEENFDVYDRSRGSIKKMFIEGRNQYILQEFDVGVVTVLTQIVRDTAGNPLSAQSNKLLNTIVYPYIGQYGIGNVPESFAFGKHAKYFVDNNKGVICRLSTDGITPLSILYKVNNFFVEKLQGFKETLNTPAPFDGTPTVYGAFDAYTNKYTIALSEINNSTVTQQAYTFAFLESRKANEGFEAELSFHPENMGALNNLFITFKDGQPWVHNNDIYNNFYGVQYSSYVDVTFNERSLDRKTFLSLMETANTVWYCPSIQSQLNSYGSTPQTTSLVAARFALLEGQYQSAILRDANSPGGIINGDTMHGNYLVVRFQKDNASEFYYLNTVSLNYINSPLNLR